MVQNRNGKNTLKNLLPMIQFNKKGDCQTDVLQRAMQSGCVKGSLNNHIDATPGQKIRHGN